MTALPRSLLDALEPIDPRNGQVDRVPGIDALCPKGHQDACQFPWCTCYRPDRSVPKEDT